MKNKKAIITGITGQDGAYLSKLLLSKGYKVYGTFRRLSTPNFWRLNYLGILNKVELIPCDLLDQSSIVDAIKKVQPDEFYNLAAQSFVGASFEQPVATGEISGIGVVRILDAIRHTKPDIKFYQASSSEMYGGAERVALTEDSKFEPKSPYAAAKVFAYDISKIYRESYDMFATNGILFNHESPRRGETFVTRKISKAVGRISVGIQSKLTLGNLEAFRDWGFAGDYVEAMWRILQHNKPEDWVIATGETHSVSEFVKEAFSYVDLEESDYVATSEKYFRPNEVEYLLGDPSKAESTLGWKPSVMFKDLVKLMVENDIKEAKKEYTLLKEGLISPTWEHPLSIKN